MAKFVALDEVANVVSAIISWHFCSSPFSLREIVLVDRVCEQKLRGSSMILLKSGVFHRTLWGNQTWLLEVHLPKNSYGTPQKSG